jgi:caffeoyl-CoA O-methyltransferase
MIKLLDERLVEYSTSHSAPEGELLERLRRETEQNLAHPQMLSGRLQGRFMRLLAQLMNAKRIIEVGTFSGYSALSMAEALPPDGELFTCDEDPIAIAVARRYFAESPHGSKITLLEGPALRSLESLEGPFDMAFIDADKTNYLNYFEAIVPLMRPGGLIMADNVLWSGNVLDPKEEDDHALRDFNTAVSKDPRVEGVLVPIRDGLFCLRKK